MTADPRAYRVDPQRQALGVRSALRLGGTFDAATRTWTLAQALDDPQAAGLIPLKGRTMKEGNER